MGWQLNHQMCWRYCNCQFNSIGIILPFQEGMGRKGRAPSRTAQSHFVGSSGTGYIQSAQCELMDYISEQFYALRHLMNVYHKTVYTVMATQ